MICTRLCTDIFVLLLLACFDRGCCWEDAVNLLDAASSEANNSNTSIKNNNKKKNSIVNGFYCTRNAYQGRHFIALAIEKAVIIHSHAAALAINVTIIRPTTGRNEMNRMVRDERKHNIVFENPILVT